MSMLQFKNYSISLMRSNSLLIDNLSFKVEKGQSLGIVGESGSGKSLTALSVLRLLNYKVFETSGEIFVDNRNIFELNELELNEVRGNEVSMIFQEPMLSLNPVKSLHSQINECLELSKNPLSNSDIIHSLHAVGLSDTDKILKVILI